MFVLLQETVRPDIINASGLAIGLGGIVLTALWLHYLYR